jgi:hypothetical protein
MDPVTMSVVLLAIASGAAGKAGEGLWNGVIKLIRRPFAHRDSVTDPAAPAISGIAELVALEREPHSQDRALKLAEAVVARADSDDSFRRELEVWWGETEAVRGGNVTNTVSGGTFNGPVVMGRDFSRLTFGTPPADEPRSSS